MIGEMTQQEAQELADTINQHPSTKDSPWRAKATLLAYPVTQGLWGGGWHCILTRPDDAQVYIIPSIEVFLCWGTIDEPR